MGVARRARGGSKASSLFKRRRAGRIRQRKAVKRLRTTEGAKVNQERDDEREGEEMEAVGEGDCRDGADVDTGEEEEEEEEEEEGENEGDAAAHSRLLSAITHIGSQKRSGQRSEATPTVSEYNLSNQSEGEEVSIGGLLGGLGEEGRGVHALRRQLATAASHQLLPPATKQQMEKAHRALAYSSACKDVSKWLPVVTHNRKVDHLSFPLQEESIPRPSLASQSEGFQAVTGLEKAVWSVVGRSEAVLEASDVELTAAERAELVRVMGEEGRERVRESRRWRVLMSQYEAKCQRERRIKSRRFHKIQRKRREKAREGGEDGRREEGEEERAERLRAAERMTLRHSRQGKWAREVLARKKRDPLARSALSEHSLRGRALTQHPPVESEESGSETMENDLLPQAAGLPDHHRNPWLQSSVPVLLLNSEFQPEAREEEEQEVRVNPTRQLVEVGSGDSGDEDQSHDVTSSASTSKKLNDSSNKNQSHDVTSSVRASNITTPNIDPKANLSVGVALGVASKQLLAVREAFAGDDVVAEFAREKAAMGVVEAEEEGSGLTLPGWGRWGGEGTKPIKKKQVVLKAQNKPRSDRELDHVIIGDHDNMKINKHLVKKLPWPYSTPQQFNRAHTTPLGRQWNSEVVHRQLVTPRVETAVGVAIPPVRLTDDVKDFIKRHTQNRTQKNKRVKYN